MSMSESNRSSTSTSTETSQGVPAHRTANRGNIKLPNTGDEGSASTIALGVMSALAGLGLVAKKRKRDEDEE